MRLAALFLLLLCGNLFAQTPAAFYNVTGIKTKKLSNAIQVVIQTDGDVTFRLDYSSLYTVTASGEFRGGQTTGLRFRLIGARTKLPTFTNIGAYPIDAIVLTPGNAPLNPLFGADSRFDLAQPNVDVELRTYVPIGAQNGGGNDDEGPSLLSPLAARIEKGADRRSIQITLVTDRVDTDRVAARMDRSPKTERNSRLEISGSKGVLDIRALHSPLSELIPRLSEVTKVPIAVQTDAQNSEVSLSLVGATLPEVLRMLERAGGLSATSTAEGGFLLGKSGEALVTEQIPLRYLDPQAARLLLPDFLLPSMRADLAVNTLILTATPEVIRRVRSDLALLDRPRPQVKITASAYELEMNDGERASLTAALTDRSGTQTLTGDAATLAVTLSPGARRTLDSTLLALKAEGRSRLVSEPSLVVASGATGTLFAGQDRFLTVLRQGYAGLTPKALKVAVGTSLTATPQLSDGGEILLTLAPRFATVVSREAGSGLPTVGVREASATLRLKPGQTALVAVLDSSLFESSRKTLSPAARKSRQSTSFLLLVRAESVPETK